MIRIGVIEAAAMVALDVRDPAYALAVVKDVRERLGDPQIPQASLPKWFIRQAGIPPELRLVG